MLVTPGLAGKFVFPAPAGINRHGVRRGCNELCVPRASGDKPLLELSLYVERRCSPRQRG